MGADVSENAARLANAFASPISTGLTNALRSPVSVISTPAPRRTATPVRYHSGQAPPMSEPVVQSTNLSLGARGRSLATAIADQNGSCSASCHTPPHPRLSGASAAISTPCLAAQCAPPQSAGAQVATLPCAHGHVAVRPLRATMAASVSVSPRPRPEVPSPRLVREAWPLQATPVRAAASGLSQPQALRYGRSVTPVRKK